MSSAKSYHDEVWAIYEARIRKLLKGYTPDLRQTTGALPITQVPSGIPGTRLGAGTVTPTELSFDPATQAELDAEAATRAADDTALAAPSYLVTALSGTLTNERRVVAGTGITLTDGGANGDLTIAASGGGSGTVTSVGLTVPSILAVAGSPITGAGTLAVTLATQTANTTLAGPASGGAVAPTFRALVAADIPSLDMSKFTTGQLPLYLGGTGTSLAGTGGANQIVRQSTLGGSLGVSILAAADLPNHSAALLTSGLLALARGGTNADLSATGGANQIVRQNSAGGALTASILAAADIPSLDSAKIATGEVPRSPLTTRGDLLTRNATVHSRIAIGTSGKYVRSDGTDPSWATLDMADAGAGTLAVARGGRGVTISPIAQVSSAVNQTVAASTFVKVVFGNEASDTNNNFASSTFTPTVAGLYLVTAQLLYATAEDQKLMGVYIYFNGARSFLEDSVVTSGTGFHRTTLAALARCNGTTDYLDIYTYHASAASKVLDSAGTAAQFVWIAP